MILDAGQKKIGLESCKKCGMVYNVDEPADVKQHDDFHNRFIEEKSFRVSLHQIEAWKRFTFHDVVSTPLQGYLFRINSFSTSTLRRKFEEIVNKFVNIELGYCEDLPIWDKERKREALIFIKEAETGALAFLAAFVMIDFVNEAILMPEQKVYKGAFLGVERIWVHSRCRRHGLATFLLDSARRLMAPTPKKDGENGCGGGGGNLPRSRIAFGDPTEAGIQLAISYASGGGGSGGKENSSDRYILYTTAEFSKSL